jgi:transcriptional regulator with XRE-family HTH domain
MIEQVLAQTRVTVDELADEAGVSRATLYAWRNGKRNPTADNLARLADALERRGGELTKLAAELRKAADG